MYTNNIVAFVLHKTHISIKSSVPLIWFTSLVLTLFS